MKDRIIPFLNYRYYAYALSSGLFVIFLTSAFVFKGGLRLGVDFVGGQKIIAKFEKGVDEARIRQALRAYNPLVQQVGEPGMNEYIISTKLSEESPAFLRDKLVERLQREYPGIEFLSEEAIIVSSRGGVDEANLRDRLAAMDAVFQRLGSPQKSEYIIYPRESSEKKKLAYDSGRIENMLRADFRNIDVLHGMAIVALFDKLADESKIKEIAKESGVSVTRSEYAAKRAYLFNKIMTDESEQIRSDLARSFKKVEMLSVENVGPAVGDYLRKLALKLIAVSIILMTLYLAYRFEFRYSVGAMVAVLHDVILSVAFCGVADIEINIPVVAALLTIFGYSVNDTIVIFDRIRENTQIETRSSLMEIVNKSITLTMSRTILTSFLTLLTVFALFLLGGEGITDFALVLLFGMIIGIYSTVYIASPVVLAWEKLVKKVRA
ncbi:MAG: protein-export membrane protein SecF [Spirochaetes bacterium RBG_16_49_21]|nr:MAG: protein-export membrane protein SecF [Spirochaetes bacterium RBG_16_49_21]